VHELGGGGDTEYELERRRVKDIWEEISCVKPLLNNLRNELFARH